MKILYTEEAVDQLKVIEKSDPKSARIIFDHLRKLPQTYKSDSFLVGNRFYKLRRHRIGNYRAIYEVLEVQNEIHIIAIALRKSAYD